MIVGIIGLAMVLGGTAAVAALIAGQSFLVALAVYSGFGTLAALAVIAAALFCPGMQARKGNMRQADVRL